MFNHDDIWKAIDRLAQANSYSASGLAKKANLDPTTFNKSKRKSADGKPRWPSTESIAKILAVTNATMSEFLDLIEEENAYNPDKAESSIPLLSLGHANKPDHINKDGTPTGDSWDHVNLPPIKRNAHDEGLIYALKVHNNNLLPLYKKGGILIVNPTTAPRPNNRVIVKTMQGELLIKEVIRCTPQHLTLQPLNKEFEDYTIVRNDIEWIVRILWASQ